MSKTGSYEKIVEAWKHGNSAREKTMHTDGLNLYSYDLLIGITERTGTKVVFDYTRDGGKFVSQTTSTQVGMAKKYADEVRKIKDINAMRTESDGLLRSTTIRRSDNP